MGKFIAFLLHMIVAGMLTIGWGGFTGIIYFMFVVAVYLS